MKLIHLLSIFVPLSLMLWFFTLISSSKDVPTLFRWFSALFLPFLIGAIAYKKKSLSFSGLCFALLIGFILTLSNFCFMASLLMFFITSSKATKYKSEIKRLFEDNYREGGQRNWVQVVCNGGIAAELSLFYLMESGPNEVAIDFISQYNLSWFSISVLAAISCSNGDTWASELGSVIGSGDPFLITSFKRVPRGTNGGISFIGLIFSALGGLAVSIAFYFVLIISIWLNSVDYQSIPPQFVPLLIVGLFGGFVGSLIDSLLGATLQYSGRNMNTKKVVSHDGRHVEHISGVGLLDNHSVNLLSTLITGLISPYFAIRLWTYF